MFSNGNCKSAREGLDGGGTAPSSHSAGRSYLIVGRGRDREHVFLRGSVPHVWYCAHALSKDSDALMLDVQMVGQS